MSKEKTFIDALVTIGEYMKLTKMSYGAVTTRIENGQLKTAYIKGSGKRWIKCKLQVK